jgi:hypothetical protein
MPKTIVVTIPDVENVPEILSSFSPEENYSIIPGPKIFSPFILFIFSAIIFDSN